MARLNHDVRTLARHVPGAIALDVLDLNTGFDAGFNARKSMPAASTIKLPVMVAVFEQLATGRFDLNRRVTLEAQDKDAGRATSAMRLTAASIRSPNCSTR